jgi:hypothetical protein
MYELPHVEASVYDTVKSRTREFHLSPMKQLKRG